MPGRILTLQRQVRELGRLRAGLTVPRNSGSGVRPTSSKTWIATSPSRTYVEAAAAQWGGQPEEWQPLGNRPKEWRVITERPVVDAVLPPGDPLSQHYEMWTAGGCQRRCDGEREQRGDQPCVCRAQFGDDFHTQPALGPDKKPQRCQIHTRLSVFLPELPDIGIWRVETHGYWPSVHITGYVETIKALVGEQVMIPVTLGIEPRSRVEDGKTSHYVEIVVALKQRTAFGQIVANPQVLAIGGPEHTAIEGGSATPAIEAGPAAEDSAPAPSQSGPARDGAYWRAQFAAAQTIGDLRAMWTPAGNDGALDDETRKAFWAAKQRIDNATTKPAVAEHAPAVAGEVEPDRDEEWSRVLRLAGERGWNTATVSRLMRETVGKDPTEADGWAFQLFAQAILEGQVAT